MNAHDHDRKLKRLNWLIHAGGVLCLIASGFGYHLVVSSLIAQQRQKDMVETARLEGLLETADETREQHKRLTDELNELERDAELLRQRIPDRPLEDEFLRQVNQSAQLEGLTIRNYERGSLNQMETHGEFEIRLICQGNYVSICGFLDRLAELPRVTTVKKMSVTAPDRSETYPFEMTLLLYFRANNTQQQG